MVGHPGRDGSGSGQVRSGQGVIAMRMDGQHAKAFGGLHIRGRFA